MLHCVAWQADLCLACYRLSGASRFLNALQLLSLVLGGYTQSLFKVMRTDVQGTLRTRQTLEKFKAIPPQPGQTSPLLIYFGTLLTRGKLNAHESVELSQLVIQQNKKHLLDNWLKVGPWEQSNLLCKGC